MKTGFFTRWKLILAASSLLAVALAVAYEGVEYYTSTPSFCGTNCHTMDEQWEAWKRSQHNEENNAEHIQAGCIECHFLPGGKRTLKAKLIGLRHLAAYLVDPGAPIPRSPVVPDGACLRSGCHAKEAFQDKEIRIGENVNFRHKAHFEKGPQEDLDVHCDTCHIKHSAEKHFEVPTEICFLCHFKEGEHNVGAAECALCHTIPTESLQRQKSAEDADDKPITHQSIATAKVACRGCHLQHIKGKGDIRKENCRGCHKDSGYLAKWNQQALMHEQHVATRQADCFDCHRTDRHRAEADFLDTVRIDCASCHLDQHRFQRQLLLGEARDGVPQTPGLMTAVETNCTACHTSEEHKSGVPVMKGSGKACAGCHTPKHKQMLNDWRETVVKEVEFIKEMEEEARNALESARGRVAGETLNEAMALYDKGLKNLHIVEFGNGVHNKKYSIMLLDAALSSFEEIVDLLQDGG